MSIPSWIRYQWNLFLLALSFFSRIPIPSNVVYSDQQMNQSSRYFPLVGWLIAAIVCACYFLFIQLLPKDISVLLCMIVSIAITGAFHEDGLADMADGFGGGVNHEQKLAIMKDSRLGTYGLITLVFSLALKFLLLLKIENTVIALLVAYPLSRALATSFIFDMPYVSDTDKAKSKPVAKKQTLSEFSFIFVIGLLSLVLIPASAAMMLLFSLLCIRFVLKKYLIAQIGGYTGDCLGAAQQIFEISIYFFLLLWQLSLLTNSIQYI